jgi:hypothetical protein
MIRGETLGLGTASDGIPLNPIYCFALVLTTLGFVSVLELNPVGVTYLTPP